MLRAITAFAIKFTQPEGESTGMRIPAGFSAQDKLCSACTVPAIIYSTKANEQALLWGQQLITAVRKNTTVPPSFRAGGHRQTHTLCQAPIWESLLPLSYEKGCL